MGESDDDFQPEGAEDEGGAVKSFLEHLEDLRWMIIKSAAATLAGMMICLFATKEMAAILRWPLKRAENRTLIFMPPDTNTTVYLHFGGVTVHSISLATNHIGALDLGTNRRVSIDLEPTVIGTNTVLTLRQIPATSEESAGGPQLYYMGPADSFMSILHMAFFGGLFLASPFVLFFIGQFVVPALKKIEKKYFLRAFWFGLALFLAGVCMAYFVIMPPAIKFAEFTSSAMGVSSQIWEADAFFGFEVKFMMGMGLGFELPVVLLALVKIGVLNYAKLTAMRRYMIVGNLILGALLTTPEPFTQVIMAIALQLLFELAVWITWYWEREEKKRQAQGSIDV